MSQDYLKDEALLEEEQQELVEPPMYQVVLLNDDYTPMDFVVDVLQMFFSKSYEDAMNVMLAVHKKGKGVCGNFSRDVAETKAHLVCTHAQENEYPLQCVVERI